MSDNTTLNPGIGGDLIATDEIAAVNGFPAPPGLKAQRVKVGFGGDGQFIDVAPGTGLPVTGEALDILRRIAQLLKPLQQVTGSGSSRLSVDVNSGSFVVTSGNVTSVATLTNVANYGGVNAFDQAKAMSRLAYNASIRSRIS